MSRRHQSDKVKIGGVIDQMDHFREVKNLYDAGEDDRFIRKRTGLPHMGAGADWHNGNQTRWLKSLERYRDIDRNDTVIPQGITRVVNNLVQEGFSLCPDTGDEEADAILAAKWKSWTADPTQCDLASEDNFLEQTKLAVRAGIVDGDMLVNTTDMGVLQLIEAHRVRSSVRSQRKNVSYGVQLEELTRRHLTYFVAGESINPIRQSTWSELDDLPAWGDDGERRAWLFSLRKKRTTETRVPSFLAPIQRTATQRDDIDFAELVKQQVCSQYNILRQKRAIPNRPGNRKRKSRGEQETVTIGSESFTQEKQLMATEVTAEADEEISGFSPNIPSPQYLPHIEQTIGYLSINLDLPFVVFMLDAKNTNFSGWRGAIDQAKIGFISLQQRIKTKWYSPIYRWKVSHFIDEDPRLQSLMDSGNVRLFNHDFRPPIWTYIEPMKDAAAASLRVGRFLSTLSQEADGNGRKFPELAAEGIGDNALLIRLAAEATEELQRAHPILAGNLDWREVLTLPLADRVNANWSFAPLVGDGTAGEGAPTNG